MHIVCCAGCARHFVALNGPEMLAAITGRCCCCGGRFELGARIAEPVEPRASAADLTTAESG